MHIDLFILILVSPPITLILYRSGFYDGVLIVGEFKGKKIQDVKKSLQSKLVKENTAKVYYEPEKTIISRSGDECVVALCNQWYLDYGDEAWKAQVEKALEKINTYHDEVRKNFQATFKWLHEYACSRTYGLGEYTFVCEYNFHKKLFVSKGFRGFKRLTTCLLLKCGVEPPCLYFEC